MANTEHLTNIVVVALIHRDGKILMGRRAMTKKTWPGELELIGGHVDPGENLEAALVREIQEEIEVTVKPGRIVHAFTYDSEDMFKVEVCYLCSLDEGQEPKLNPEDHSEFVWLSSDQVETLDEDDEKIAVEKAFEVLEGAA